MLDSEDNGPVLGILDYLRMIRERWVLGLAIGILLAGIWSLYQLSRKPLYTSFVKVLVEILDDQVVDMQQVVDEQDFIARSNRADSLLNQHLLKMNSGEFRHYVIESLSASQIRQILDPYRTPELAEPSLNGILNNAVEFEMDNKSLVYRISATHLSPRVAAMIADTYAQQYIRYILVDLGSSNDTAISFLDIKARDLEKVIQRKELELQTFRKKHNIVSIEASQQLALSQLQQYQAEQTRLTVEQQNISSLMEQIENTEGMLENLLKIPEIASYRNVSQYAQELELARAARDQLSIELLEMHPRMLENQSMIEEYSKLLESETSFAVDSFKTVDDKLKAQYSRTGTLIEKLQSEVQGLEALAIEYDSMVRSILGDKTTLSQITQRLNETQIASQLSNANMRVIDSASVPRNPSSPDLKKTAIVGAMLFIFGFFGIPIGFAFIDNKVKNPFDIEQFIHKPLLGEIFRFSKAQRERVGYLVRDGDDELLVDAFRSVYNNVKLNDSRSSDKKVQVVTSTLPHEGKTMFSMNYGAVVSQHGTKTLLVDCDLRKPRIHTYLSLPSEKGLVTWFNSGDDIPNGNILSSSLGIQQLGENAFILPAGSATNQSTELVESDRFKALINRLSEEFDAIIIDTPPIGVFPDAMFLADYAQDVIYISSVNRVPRKTVKRFVDQLDKTEANVCGVVLNGRKASQSEDDYAYGYSRKYAKKYY